MVNDRSPNKRRGHRGHYKSHSLWENLLNIKRYQIVGRLLWHIVAISARKG